MRDSPVAIVSKWCADHLELSSPLLPSRNRRQGTSLPAMAVVRDAMQARKASPVLEREWKGGPPSQTTRLKPNPGRSPEIYRRY